MATWRDLPGNCTTKSSTRVELTSVLARGESRYSLLSHSGYITMALPQYTRWQASRNTWTDSVGVSQLVIGFQLSLAGGATCMLVMTKLCLSRQIFVMTNMSLSRQRFCLDKHTFLSLQKMCFVAIKVCLSQQNFRCDKILFVMTNIFCDKSLGTTKIFCFKI